MAQHEIFYAICDLFNEGEVVVDKDIAFDVISAARETFPEFEIEFGEYDRDKGNFPIHVTNYAEAK